MARTWRTFVSPILLLLVVGALAAAGYWGYNTLISPWATPTPAPCVLQTMAGELTAGQVTVRVYNNGTVPGRARTISTQLKDKGFAIGFVGNSKDSAITATTIKGATANAPEIALVKGFFPDATVVPDQRTTRTVDVIVVDEFAGLKEDAPTSIAVPGGTVCLPPSPTPSAGTTGAQLQRPTPTPTVKPTPTTDTNPPTPQPT